MRRENHKDLEHNKVSRKQIKEFVSINNQMPLTKNIKGMNNERRH